MASLNIWNFFTCPIQGVEYSGKHGSSGGDPVEPFTITVGGYDQGGAGILTTGSVQTLWTTSTILPTPFDYFHFWADQITYLQFISASTNFVMKVLAKTPFVLPGYGSFVAAASTTAITGGTEPTPTLVTSIILGNYSGSTANYQYHVIS